MKKKIITPLVKNTMNKDENKATASTSGCCGGTPTTNADACCKLDDDRKSAGEAGCGCNTTDDYKPKKSSCC